MTAEECLLLRRDDIVRARAYGSDEFVTARVSEVVRTVAPWVSVVPRGHAGTVWTLRAGDLAHMPEIARGGPCAERVTALGGREGRR